MSSLMKAFWPIAVICSISIAQFSGEMTTPPSTFSSTLSVQQNCTECLSAGTCEVMSTACLCHQGISGTNCDVCALDCQNAGRCDIGHRRGVCRCINATTGFLCEVYHTPANASLVGNVAANSTVFQCRAGGPNINLANSSLWRHHVCYNMSIDDVILVDLGEQHDVSRVSMAVYNTPFVNMTVKVGVRLADMCDVLNGVTCGQVGGIVTSPLLTTVCNHTGRFLRVHSRTGVVCLVAVVGSVVIHTQTTARFRAHEDLMFTSQVPPFNESSSVSKIDCARRCMKSARCLNFRWNGTHCMIYGGPPAPGNTHLTYTWV